MATLIALFKICGSCLYWKPADIMSAISEQVCRGCVVFLEIVTSDFAAGDVPHCQNGTTIALGIEQAVDQMKVCLDRSSGAHRRLPVKIASACRKAAPLHARTVNPSIVLSPAASASVSR